MKILAIVSSILALGASSTLALEAQRATGQVSIRATVKTSKENTKTKDDKDKKDKGPKTEIVNKSLDIALSGAKTVTGPLKVSTTFFGRDADTKDTVVAKKLDEEVTLDAAQTAKITTPEVNFTSVAAHTKDVNGQPEKVAASGQSYYGWVIRVYQGEILAGEAASTPPLLKVADAPAP